MKRHTTASCFATYMLPHVLFVADFEERERIARVCCLAWNIGLFPDAAERAHHIENTLTLFFDGEEAPPPPGARQGYGEELHMLADLKRDLFPWRFENVMEAGLKRTPRGDVLVVNNGKTVERIELSRPLPSRGCPSSPKRWRRCMGTRRRSGGRWRRPAPRRGWSSRWRPRTW